MNRLKPHLKSYGPHFARWMFFAAMAWALLAVYVSYGYGLADNGDYGRIMKPFASMPLGFDENWPEAGSAAYKVRFWTFWYPDWKPGAEGGNLVQSSAWALWWPGVALDRALFSDGIRHLPIVGLPLKALLLGVLCLVGRGLVRRYGVAGGLLTLVIAWVMFDVASLGYLNTFYQESAQVVGCALLAVALAWWASREPSVRWRSAIYPLCAAFLISTSKNASFHVVALVAFVLAAYTVRDSTNRNRERLTALVLALIGCLAAGVAFNYARGTADMVLDTKMHSFFAGVMTVSKDPKPHFRAEGLPDDALKCIGESAYSQIGRQCRGDYAEKLGYGATIRAVMREPSMIWPLAVAGADGLHVATPFAHRRTPQYSAMDMNGSALAAWSAFKETHFPRGAAAVLSLGAVVVVSILLFLRGYSHVLFAGLFAMIASVELVVAILGAGKIDLDKHLFLANISVDYLLVFCVLGVAEKWRRTSLTRFAAPVGVVAKSGS